MNMKMKQTSLVQRVLTGALALVMTLSTFAGVGGTMAADIDSGDGSAVVESRGGVSVQAFTQDFLSNELEGDASLLGAEFTVYDADGKEFCVIATNEAGFATTGATMLPLGTYSIKQTKAPTGYRLNSVWEKTFEIVEDAQVAVLTDGYRWTDAFDFESNDPADNRGAALEVIRGGLRIYTSTKDRSETGATSDDGLGEGDADLAGSEFVIVNESAHPVMVNGQKFEKGKAVMTVWSNENGVAETSADALPYGLYAVYQVESPDGLFIDSGFIAAAWIREDGVIYDVNAYDNNPVQQPIYRGGFEMQKIDAILNAADVQGDASLELAVFGVVNNSAFDVYVGGQWYKPGDICHSFGTDANGYANVLNLVLPYGSYSIIEMTASEGYQVNKDFKIDFQIREDGKVYDLTGTAFPEYVITGDVQIIKNDKELGKSEAIGGKDHGNNEFGSDLNGITYAITNKSAKAVVVDGKTYQPGDVVTTITTHWNAEKNAYTAETTGSMLPYGTYSIQEIATNASYLLTDKNVYTFQIREQDKVVTADVNGTVMNYYNQVIRGDIMFEKVEDETMSRMSTLWVLTNLSTGERHVLAADKNGEYLSNSNMGFKHSEQTNANDALLSRIDAGDVIPMADVIQGAGTWFGLGEAGSMAIVNDNLGALPYGKYNLQEVATDSNAEYHRELKSVDFYIYRDSKVVDLGTIINGHAAPSASLTTSAVDDTTGSSIGIVSSNVTIIDTVSYDNLVAGYTYKLIGTLYSKKTGGPLVVNGETITVEHKFTATQSSGEIDMVFNFDGSDLAGDSVVVFQTLIDVYTDTKGNPAENKILDHNDINNAKQTVVYPAIDSELVFDETNTHDSAIGSSMTVTDTVYYENLVPGRNYTIEGTLMDVATGNDAVDANGNDIHASVTFTADAASGSVKLTYKFDASNMAGKTLVAFEDILYRNVVVARHDDWNAVDQMIYFPVIDTDANCETTGNNEGVVNAEIVIEDVVSFKGLIPNEEYTLTGKLIDKESGDVIADVVKTFKTGTSEGFVSVMFNVDSTVLAGKTVVAVEYLTRSGNALAEHADMDDADQTITFPAIEAELAIADSDDRMSGVGEKTVLIDTVKYSNLVVGEEYKVVGNLMDKFSGAAVVDAEGNPITAETVFKPESADGSVEIRFEFDSRHLAGDSVVAFTFLNRNDVMLVKQADIEDDAISFAGIDTVLFDKEFNDDEIAVSEVTLVDVVSYKNLIAGVEYEIKTVLMDKETGKALNGFEAIVTKFTPDAADGDVVVEFKLDAANLAGKTLVAFETIMRDGEVIIEHADIEDVAQTVTLPAIDASAILNETNVVDTIQYNNLQIGRNYVMISEVISAEGKVLDRVVAIFVPKTEQGMIKANIEFTFDVADYAGQDIIVRESLYGQMGQFLCMDETVLSIPAEEIAPPVTEPPATEEPEGTEPPATEAPEGTEPPATEEPEGTEPPATEEPEGTEPPATEEPEGTEPPATEDPEGTEPPATEAPDDVTPLPHAHAHRHVDTVDPTCVDAGYEIWRCPCGDTYTRMNASAVGHSWGEWVVTKEATVDAVGERVRECAVCHETEVAEIEMIPGEVEPGNPEGTEPPATEAPEGTEPPATEKPEGTEPPATEDPEGTEPPATEKPEGTEPPATEKPEETEPPKQEKPDVSVKLQSYDKASGTLNLAWGENVVIDNKVIFDKLPMNYEYSFTFTLIDAETGKPVEIDGKSVGAAMMLNRAISDGDHADTYATCAFGGIDTTKLEGRKFKVEMIVKAKVNGEYVTVAEIMGKDIMTVVKPVDDLYVTVISVKTNSAVLEIAKDVKIQNTIKYNGLEVDKAYVIRTMLLDADGKIVKDNDGEQMIVEKTFIADKADGEMVVTFGAMSTEKLQGKKFTVKTVIMLNGKTIISESDDEVFISDLDTKATSDKKTKYLILGKNVVLVDTVEYFNLIPGQKYYIEGRVLNAKTGKLVLGAQGKDPIVKMSFVPTEANGKLEMKFYLDTSNADGETYVVVQTLYDENGNKLALHQDLKDKDQSVVIKTIADVQTGVYEHSGLITVLAVVTMLAGVAFVVIGRKRNLFSN